MTECFPKGDVPAAACASTLPASGYDSGMSERRPNHQKTSISGVRTAVSTRVTAAARLVAPENQ